MNTLTNSHSSSFLRRVLLADAIVSGGTGLLLMGGGGLVKDLLGLPVTLMQYAGFSLLPFAALVAWIAMRDTISRPAVWAIIAYNALWAADSILLLLTGWVSPTALGVAFVIAQAVVVAGFAELQYVGLRRSAAAA
jgi:hypothetical protein